MYTNRIQTSFNLLIINYQEGALFGSLFLAARFPFRGRGLIRVNITVRPLSISLLFITLVKPLLEIRLLLPVMAVLASVLEVGFQ